MDEPSSSRSTRGAGGITAPFVQAEAEAEGAEAQPRHGPASRHYRQAKADRGGETRQRLVLAALDIFGRYGFEAAPTREIARRADANLAAIVYHFGGKEALHRAVAEYVVAQVGSRIGPMLESVAAGDLSTLPPGEAVDRLKRLAATQVEFMLGTAEAELWARFIMREQMDPSAAFEVIYEFMAAAHVRVARLVGIALREDPASERVRVRAFSMMGQILVFRFCHPAVLRLLEKDAFTTEDRAFVAGIIGENIEAILMRGAS